eukprot:2914074-Heterocapsa_arctica.AAC.1
MDEDTSPHALPLWHRQLAATPDRAHGRQDGAERRHQRLLRRQLDVRRYPTVNVRRRSLLKRE